MPKLDRYLTREFAQSIFAALVVLAVAGAWMYQRYRDAARFTDYVQRLRSEPGIVVTRAERGDGAWQIAGLRDPLAAEPDKLRALAGLAPGSVVETWEPYQTLQPSFVLRRMEASLDPPPTVALLVEQGRVRASGSASRTWVEKARSMSSLLPLGVPQRLVCGARDTLVPNELSTRYAEAARHEAYQFFRRISTPPAVGEDVLPIIERLGRGRHSVHVSSGRRIENAFPGWQRPPPSSPRAAADMHLDPISYRRCGTEARLRAHTPS